MIAGALLARARERRQLAAGCATRLQVVGVDEVWRRIFRIARDRLEHRLFDLVRSRPRSRPRQDGTAQFGHNRIVLLNLDAGERDDETEELWRLFDVLNIACGGHAGDAVSMKRLVELCAREGMRVGAHPSYPDREGFGRRSLTIGMEELAASVAAQCTELAAIARDAGVAVESVKPHGALYHDAARSAAIARAVLDGAIGALGSNIAVIGPPHGPLRELAATLGVRYAREGFADRRMHEDGTLVPRSEPGALVTDPARAAEQAVALAPTVDTICMHADTPNALAIARAVREALRG